jgi:hypothetical protein
MSRSPPIDLPRFSRKIGTHPTINPSIGFTLIFALCYEWAFTCRSWMETSYIRIFPIQEYLVYPCDGLERYNGYA